MNYNTNSPAPTINEQPTTTLSIPYSVKSQDIQIEVRNGEIWFLAKDVCDLLEIANSRDALMKLDDDEKGVAIADTLGGRQSMNWVNESGLYNLIFQSRKPEAKRFRKWVTAEVLPSIRRTGGYKLPQYVQGNLFGAAAPNMAVLMNMIRQQEIEGHTWYNATDLLIVSGKLRSGQSTRKFHALQSRDLARKLGDGGRWYVRQDAINEFNGYKQQHLLKTAMAEYLNQGGQNG